MSDIIHVSRILCLQNEGLYKDMTEGKVYIVRWGRTAPDECGDTR
jgi:hypothetical protein